MEELWKGPDAQQIWVRPIRKAEKLPRQGLSQIMYTAYTGMISSLNADLAGPFEHATCLLMIARYCGNSV
jgi:hypothetical protein